jgi:hypothetical protein
MTRIAVRIGSIVVRDGLAFGGDAFGEALRTEIAHRLESGADARAIASRFRSGARQGRTAQAQPPTKVRGAEAAVAASVAGRLLP